MGSPWLHIVGIGEDGEDGLTPATRGCCDGGSHHRRWCRHHKLAGNLETRIRLAVPFDAMIETISPGKRVVIVPVTRWYQSVRGLAER